MAPPIEPGQPRGEVDSGLVEQERREFRDAGGRDDAKAASATRQWLEIANGYVIARLLMIESGHSGSVPALTQGEGRNDR